MTNKMRLVASAVLITMSSVAMAESQSFTSVQAEEFSVKGSLSNAWGDFDNDGDLDLLVSIKGGEVRLYRNDDGVFTNIGPEVGLPQSGVEIRGVSWGDFNNDGYLDILGGSSVYPFANRSYVWRSNKGESFTEVAEEIGLTIHGRVSRQASWVDVNNDGQSDLYAADRTGANRLFYNKNGKFSPASETSGTYDIRPTVGACWFDFDEDGDLDLFLANQSGGTDALMRNDGDKFVDVAKEMGMDQAGRTREQGGVGCAVGDYDNDGKLDLYVATYGENLLYHNEGDGTFKEVGKELGVTGPDHTVSAAWGDYNNDGLLDLIAVGYHKVDGVSVPYGKLYLNTGNGFKVDERFPELTSAGDHGSEWIDFNNDGAIDLSVTDGYGDEGGHFVFKNNLSQEARDRALAVLVLDAQGHYTQQGAEVRFYDESGKILGTRIVSTGGGYNAQSARPVYFALPKQMTVKVEVRFMGLDKPVTVTTDPKKLAHKPLVVKRPS